MCAKVTEAGVRFGDTNVSFRLVSASAVGVRRVAAANAAETAPVFMICFIMK